MMKTVGGLWGIMHNNLSNRVIIASFSLARVLLLEMTKWGWWVGERKEKEKEIKGRRENKRIGMWSSWGGGELKKRFESWRAGSDTVQAFSIIHLHCIRASFGTLNTKTHPPHLYQGFPCLTFLSSPELHCFSHPCLSVFITHPFISIPPIFMLTHLVTV